MKIELQEITVGELAEGYVDNAEEGVRGYGGRLDIRPKYQREFVYKDAQRDAVIHTVCRGFPLNVMYWVKNADDAYEVLDGQQRTVSLCQYVAGQFSVDIEGRPYYFHTLPEDARRALLDYRLMVYFCEGSDTEKLAWFRTINIAGVKLSDQELRNAIYTGPWLTDAKRHFSRTGCPAKGLADRYVRCEVNRQELLELALKWVSRGRIEQYMADHQHDPNANALWLYFQQVVAWTKATFPTWRKEMRGLPWGDYFNDFADAQLDTAALEAEVARLMQDVEVTNKRGIYAYVLYRREKFLNLRTFDDAQRRVAYERQQGVCPHCHRYFDIDQMEADHIVPWHRGGRTELDNCQMLCRDCNREKSGK